MKYTSMLRLYLHKSNLGSTLPFVTKGINTTVKY